MRYAILSDIHANLPALRAVLDDLASQSIDATICLGDAIGYYADGAAVIALLQDLVAARDCSADGRPATLPLWVAGNHEWGLLNRIEAYQFSPAARTALMCTQADLPAAATRFLADLPQRIEVDRLLGRLQVQPIGHGAPDLGDGRLQQRLDQIEIDMVILDGAMPRNDHIGRDGTEPLQDRNPLTGERF